CCIGSDGYLEGPARALADMLHGLGHGVQVAHAVIDDCDVCHAQPVSVPLVDGTVPAMRGSGSMAMRTARPKALNTVSIWWCAFSPRRLSMCSVTLAWFTKPWKNSRAKSTSNWPIRARVYGT